MSLSLFPGSQVDPLTPARVQAGRRTRLFGREVLYYPTVGSTNDLAQEQARAGAAEGLLVLAEEQTSGRGRQGRSWLAPFGSSILASLLLRPEFLPPTQAFLITAMAATSIAEAISRQSGLRAEVKWPNDVLLGGRKVCGILVELEGHPGHLEWAVLGWGLNVNIAFSADEELASRATSLAAEVGRPLSRLALLHACLEQLEVRYQAVRAGRGEEVWAEWRTRLGMLGHPVEVAAPEGTFSGLALDVDGAGALLVRQEDGQVVRVLAGDVVWRPAGPSESHQGTRP